MREGGRESEGEGGREREREGEREGGRDGKVSLDIHVQIQCLTSASLLFLLPILLALN